MTTCSVHFDIRKRTTTSKAKKLLMKTTIRVLTSVVLVFTTNVPYAQDRPSIDVYGEVGALHLKIKFADGSTVVPKLVRTTVGTNINENLAIEGILGSTFNRDEEVSAAMAGAFLRSHLPVTEDIELFGRLGRTRTILGGAASGSMNQTAYGLGLQKQFTKDVYGQIDYMLYGRGPKSESVRGLSVSVGTRF